MPISFFIILNLRLSRCTIKTRKNQNYTNITIIMKKRDPMSEIINKPQPPVVRSGCKAPPPFRRIPGGAGKPGTKKGDSRKNLPHSHARQNYLLQHAPSAFSAQHDLVESHFSAQQDLDESHASASHFASQPAQAEASVATAAASPWAAFLFELPQQLTIATAAITTTKEKIFFIASKV